MKKTRFIPYGYTMRDGRTVIAHDEADIIRHIFEVYIKGASLKEIAEELTRRQIPYTEKTCVWDKARIARIIDNARYTGSDDYDPIIDETVYEEAVATKSARQRNVVERECEGIALIRNRVKCSKCGHPMVRRVTSKRTIKESWTCTNPECGCRLRISDTDLLMKINLLINRIIENSELMVPKPKHRHTDSPTVRKLQEEINAEMEREHPSEEFIISKICDIASQLYKETNAKDMIVAQVARKRALLMKPQEVFNCDYFTDLIETVVIDANGSITLYTKTDTVIAEGEETDGSTKDSKENRHTD